MINRNLFRAQLARVGLTQRSLAPLVGMTENALSLRVSGIIDVDSKEISAMCKAMGITEPVDIVEIFLQ